METFELINPAGVVVCTGPYFALLAWVHRHHSYSFDHATRYEGYRVRTVAP